MSFLNPVNEPVKRFSSTDTGAPQINYNARVAGDVKTVLKACLVKGYGDKPSAGWSIINEVDHVAEFVSPSDAMSDYRLGIDDTSTTSTTWYYQFQDVRTNPTSNAVSKSFSSIDRSSINNGWELIATDKGLFFIERIHNPAVNNQFGRVTYWGQVKSALTDTTGMNIAFLVVGYGAPVRFPHDFFSPAKNSAFYRVGAHSAVKYTAANIPIVSELTQTYGESGVAITNPLYLLSGTLLIGEQPGLLLKSDNLIAGLYGINDDLIDSRPVYKICISVDNGTASTLQSYARVILIYLDYWEY